jgi:alkylation response protein AidB-like acyl-CoA dehydrogenase
MNNMFVVMNEARLGTGLQGLAIGAAAYQGAVTFAKDRLQGRALTGPQNPTGPADSIMVHPDVRRMLLEARAFVEGGQAFILWTALQADLQESADEATAQKAKRLHGPADPGAESLSDRQGLPRRLPVDAGPRRLGLHRGVHGISQYLRDARITMIYEGTNGIQALDLVGRKLPSQGRPRHHELVRRHRRLRRRERR